MDIPLHQYLANGNQRYRERQHLPDSHGESVQEFMAAYKLETERHTKSQQITTGESKVATRNQSKAEL